MCSVKYVSLHGLQKNDNDIHAYINGYVILYTQSVQCVQLFKSICEGIYHTVIKLMKFLHPCAKALSYCKHDMEWMLFCG